MAVSAAVLDCDLLLHGRGHRSLQRFDLRSASEPFLLSTFGFPRHFICSLVELLGDALSRRTRRSRAISPDVQVLAALGFYTSGSFQSRLGDSMGISQASMSRCVSHVTDALVDKAPRVISLSRDAGARRRARDEFCRVAGMPRVLGAVDCAHVAIKAPHAEDVSYVNRKGFHSIKCQLVCDARGLLLSAETHYPGSVRDRDLLSRSAVRRFFQGEQSVQGQEGWLLGDLQYPLKRWLMTPLLDPKTPAEFRYNLAHATTHQIVERTFRAIQTRFRCLDAAKGYLQYSPEKCARIILACCVLHNLSLQAGLDAWTLEPSEVPEQMEDRSESGELLDPEAFSIRQELILTHFS